MKRLAILFSLAGLLTLLGALPTGGAGQAVAMVGNPEALREQYEAWKAQLDPRPRSALFELLHALERRTAQANLRNVFNDLVARGEQIFFNETFNGNGRTCGTCHPAVNNFTLDPDFIATLPDSDPLFVAEFVPELIFGDPANLDANGRPQRFENPELMREFGLFLLNPDGTDDLENRFVMRSVPHNIGLTVTTRTPLDGLTPPGDRTGWGGDGAPSGRIGPHLTSGRLRDFVVGAVVQHFPRTLARSFSGPDADLRLPTVAELDAVEAFLLSLGRQVDLELRDFFPDALVLENEDAEAGKVLFRDGFPRGTLTCQSCHANGGANVLPGGPFAPGNRNFNTGVESFLQNRIDDPNLSVAGEPRPVDGGFGTNPAGNFASLVEQPGHSNENFGNGTFNTASIVEAADTAPYFHNNSIAGLEGAIALYNSPEFIEATDLRIPFDGIQIIQVAQFLRVINAIDNIENFALRSADKATRALGRDPNDEQVIARLLQLTLANSEDAEQVLEQGDLHNTGELEVNAVKQIHKAGLRFRQALNPNKPDAVRIDAIRRGTERLRYAIGLMRTNE